MKLRGLITICIILIGTVATIIHIKHIYGSQAARTILFKSHRSFSQTAQNSMNLFAKEQEKITTSSALLSDIIKDTFPAVKKVCIHAKTDGHIKVSFTPHTPVALINEKHLLIKSGALLNKNDLSDDFVNHLPSVTVVQKDTNTITICPSLCRFINRSDNSLYRNYTVTWFDKTHIELRDKQEKQFVLLASDQTVFSESLFSHYTQLKQGVTSVARAQKTKNWYVDVRFKDQIVLFAQKGERG